MNTLTLGSLFDGSGGFPLAGTLNGITPVWASEIEPYPIAVTRSRFPHMRHLGNVVEVHGDQIPPVDVITFGSPCQDMSVAGKRSGLDGSRSGLFHEAIRIIKEMREATNGEYPKYAVWENVPGAFSSNGGEDFRCVLEAFTGICGEEVSIPGPARGKWNPAGEVVGTGYSVAWRTLDAQYWGVPQRRKRIYIVADFRGGRAGEILFERESVRRDSAAGRTTWQGATTDAAGSAAGSAGELIQPCVCNESGQGYWMPGFGCLRAEGENRPSRPSHLVCFAQNQRDELRDLGEKTGALAAEQGMHQQNFIALKCLNPWDCQSKRIYQPEGVYPTLPAMDGGGANNQAIIYALDSMSSNSMKSSNPRSGFHEETVAKTLQAGGVAPTCNQGGNVIVEPVYALQGNGIDRADTAGCNGRGWREDVCYDARWNGDGARIPTLTGDHESRVTDYTAVAVYRNPKIGEYAADATTSTMVARDFKSPRDLVVECHPVYGVDCRNAALDEEKTHTLQAKDSGGQSLNCTPSVLTSGTPPRKYIIRRLTPLECCRLQGFPDGWGVPDAKDALNDVEADFWENVRKTYTEINGKSYKPMKRESLTKWYNALHTDSAEYKMWGNGIALPCAAFVLEGIAEALVGGIKNDEDA